MHAQHQKGIPPAIPKGPIDDHEIYTMRKGEKIKKAFFFFTIIPFFAYCHFKETHTELLPF